MIRFFDRLLGSIANRRRKCQARAREAQGVLDLPSPNASKDMGEALKASVSDFNSAYGVGSPHKSNLAFFKTSLGVFRTWWVESGEALRAHCVIGG